MRERDIVKAILAWLRVRGYFAEKLYGSPYQRSGLSDIVACCGGRFVAIEVKRPGEEATPVQRRVIAEIVAAGGLAFVATSVADVRRVLEG